MPIYWFALSNSHNIRPLSAIAVFAILHVFAYPASNGYNSYYDRDTSSIGGLRNPPGPTRALYWLVLVFDMLAVGLSLFLSSTFAIMVAVYLLVSKAYSYDGIRLKKYPILSAVVVSVFQGAFVYCAVQVGLGMPYADILSIDSLAFAIIATAFLSGSYPLTQVYQHDADARRGDSTLSMKLGLRGTFIFSGAAFLIAGVTLLSVYACSARWIDIGIFLLLTAPIAIVFLRWARLTVQDANGANFDNAMHMNTVSSIAMSGAFVVMLIVKSLR